MLRYANSVHDRLVPLDPTHWHVLRIPDCFQALLCHIFTLRRHNGKKKLAALVTWTRLGRDIEQVRCQQITEKTSQ